MSHARRRPLSLVVPLTITLLACGPTEPLDLIAQHHLTGQGYRGIELTPQGDDTFGFAATNAEGASCSGTVRVSAAGGRTNVETSSSCRRTSATAPGVPICTTQTPGDCVAIGYAHMQAGRTEEALGAWQIGCKGEARTACHNLGLLYLGEGGVQADAPRAAEYFDRGCERGHGGACYQRARLLERADPPRRDEATRLYHRACTLDTEVCELAAVAVAHGNAPDPRLAVELAESGCTRSSQAACGILGLLFSQGSGVERDLARGKSLLTGACGAGIVQACYNLGVLLGDGAFGAPQLEEAFALFERACQREHALACVNIGVALENGAGTARDPARGHAAYLTACKLRNGMGCHYAGLDYREGIGVAADPALAAQHFTRACELGHADGCQQARAVDP